MNPPTSAQTPLDPAATPPQAPVLDQATVAPQTRGLARSERLHLRLHSNPAEVADLQPNLLDLCAQAGLDAMAAFKLTTAIVEALNNCIEHAYGGKPGLPIDLEWTRSDEAVAVAIHDEGQALPARALDPATPASADADGGRGWQIIHEWTHAVSYRRTDNRNVLTLTYYLT